MFNLLDFCTKFTFDRVYWSSCNSFQRTHSTKRQQMILSVPNCSLVENILDTFRIAPIWHDLSILRMFTVVKCRGHTNFDLSKIYEGYFQLIYNLVHLRQYIKEFDLPRKRRIYGVDSLTALKTWMLQDHQNIRKMNKLSVYQVEFINYLVPL